MGEFIASKIKRFKGDSFILFASIAIGWDKERSLVVKLHRGFFFVLFCFNIFVVALFQAFFICLLSLIFVFGFALLSSFNIFSLDATYWFWILPFIMPIRDKKDNDDV